MNFTIYALQYKDTETFFPKEGTWEDREYKVTMLPLSSEKVKFWPTKIGAVRALNHEYGFRHGNTRREDFHIVKITLESTGMERVN